MVDVAGSVGSVVSPVLQVAEWLAAPIWRPFKYLLNYKTNFDNLREEVKNLKNARDEVQRKVTDAKRNVGEIKQNVEDWQESVNKTITEAEQLIKEMCKRCARDHYRMVTEAERNVQEVGQELKDWHVDETITEAEPLIQEKANNRRCFKGFCPNFIIHYKQSKKASKLKQDVIDPLLRQEKKLDPVSYQTNPPEIWLRSSENYLAFESRNYTFKNVWDALNGENVFMIGVYGMGGLGKTTLVQEVGRKAKEEKLFDDIVFVEVSESPDIKNIQTVIANNLGLKFENNLGVKLENESERAKWLYSRMEGQKILLILDNIWEPLEFEKIGIPYRADRGRNKLLFTTRNLNVLDMMDSTNNFKMGILNETEAWTLFTKMTDLFAENIIQTHELHSLAKDVCKECKGLPIVICTIAKALKNKSHPSYWDCALRELREPSPRKYARYLEEDYAKIALSYKYLRDDELKKTFLISSLMENNTSISDLFKHVVCLDVFDGANFTMEEARQRLDILVCDLKDACLLLGGFESGQFAMHDVVRVVATTIAYVDHHVFTIRNDIEQDWKDRDKLNKCTKIFLPGKSNIISQLRLKDLDCPNLEYFCMTDKYGSSFKIPEDLFTVMSKLRVLNLGGLWQSSLPSSIDSLTNLQTLCLDNSRVKDFAIIGKLQTLKVLSLQRSNIEVFSTELGQLTQLRLLDLSYCWGLKVIAPNVISQLSQLEEFYIKGCSINWEHKVLKELKLLSNLTSLELDIVDNDVLPRDFISKELRRYKITIGCKYYRDLITKSLRILKFACNSTISQETLRGINNVEVLLIVKPSDDEEDLDEKPTSDDEEDLDEEQMLPLFNEKVIFTNLMVLKLVDISSGKIWESQLSASSYQNLTQLILEGCDKIKHAFPFSIAKSLQQLQYLIIKGCKVLEKIVEKEEGAEVVNFIFPQITKLKLEDLPKLTIFCRGAYALDLPILKTLKITRCPNFTLKYQGFQDNNEEGEIQDLESKCIFFGHKVIFTNISSGKIWECQLSVSSFQNLTQLILEGCDKIKHAFPFSIAKSLQQLQYLMIKGCTVLEKIVEKEERVEVVNFIFPRITELKLEDLPKLTIFCRGAYALELPILKTLKITRCPNFTLRYQGFQDNNEEGEIQDLESKSIFFGHKIIFTNLMVLELVNISSGKIWESQLSASSYQNLTQLILEGCDKIKHAFPFSIAKSLQQLQYLMIGDCEILEKIVEEEEEGAEVVNSFFPRLTELKLRNLPKLIVFYLGANALELLMLKTLEISNCSIFTSTYQAFQDNNKEGEIQVAESKSICLEHKINSDLKAFHFEDDVVSITWESQSKTLETSVENLSMKLLQKFYNLKVLKVCRSLSKEIKGPFDLPYLKVLDIDSCYRLTSLSTFSTYFLNLQVLQLSYCHRLTRRLITSSMAKSLVHLREISIYKCNLLTEVVEDEADATTTNISFHNLRKLSLKELDSLTCFCFGNYSFNFPYLETLVIKGCLNMKTFCPGFLSTPRLHNVKYENELVEMGGNDLNTSIQQAHKNRVNSDLSKLSLSGRDIMSIWQEEFKENFDKVETLELIKDEYTHIPIHILVKFINLENLILKISSYEEIFLYGEDEEHVGALAKLKKLKLQGLFNLKCICKQDFRFKTILQNLHSLEVRDCNNLMTLLPALSSFENLWSLEVADCIGMQNLMTSSTAKSLVSLERLSILGCKMMIEVLANDGDIEKDEIVFEKLERLLLFGLESLTGFGSRKYNLKFPSLESISVSQCFKMKTFFEGGLNMPKLRLVNEKDYSSDLNWVTQQLQNDCSKLWEESAKSYGQGAGEGEWISYYCDYCDKDITGRIRMRCAICPDFDLCVECFSVGAEVETHKSNHPYKVHDEIVKLFLNLFAYWQNCW
ncbi:uncharacterized protein LOC123208782 isoform X1 [Mangifera indica]|uniref:uncharacterized protein LOC123208782 isoform X1 n=1 Tax=Mangifera indica TaxID=29780 RepID=UPI001CF95BA8|nr:uncharacterized protein LOC123208782 isoform X1 [Mangifera indica]XP_044482245.1 uncharacterized protein LOC123208782 isoform X1 [Mangifera indica]XP_044482247.1 uncharacterized protein LOC123208782 isoform X1 [Mangifera indica]XP_044482248.1 uncharacterized protein LOC123208782 isoform X1 [Mangifera indica]XP_044482249.1 uncharacterized protein LOC123208782 isoform X1 [Mangifera indica]XP_044482250.1 uncharacterized protein LOC123208782 isoform X1 [Mangifera indica]XP_044482251.1 uncharac